MESEKDLDAMFAAASLQRAVPSDGLMERILADAAALQLRVGVAAPVPVRRGFLATVSDWLGGSASLAAVSAAALAGLFFGIAQPSPVQAFTALVAGDTTIDSLDLLPAGDVLLAQE